MVVGADFRCGLFSWYLYFLIISTPTYLGILADSWQVMVSDFKACFPLHNKGRDISSSLSNMHGAGLWPTGPCRGKRRHPRILGINFQKSGRDLESRRGKLYHQIAIDLSFNPKPTLASATHQVHVTNVPPQQAHATCNLGLSEPCELIGYLLSQTRAAKT
jgi:hypothetical protein